jgi:hypothetical protein
MYRIIHDFLGKQVDINPAPCDFDIGNMNYVKGLPQFLAPIFGFCYFE